MLQCCAITLKNGNLKVLEKCTKNLIGHSRLAFNNHESNIDCKNCWSLLPVNLYLSISWRNLVWQNCEVVYNGCKAYYYLFVY